VIVCAVWCTQASPRGAREDLLDPARHLPQRLDQLGREPDGLGEPALRRRRDPGAEVVADRHQPGLQVEVRPTQRGDLADAQAPVDEEQREREIFGIRPAECVVTS
jgi:hypothetical protein